MSTVDANGAAKELHEVFVEIFREYTASRQRFYSQPQRVLNRLLQKDVLLYAMRGVRTADEFVEQAFAAHESSSEETAWGNAWQAGIARASRDTVGGGDLLVEREGILWIVEVKMGAQNPNSRAQDLRKLKARRDAASALHHPGRKGVMPMYAFVRGPAKDTVDHYKSNDPANVDLVGFTYHHLVGQAFLQWLNLEFEAAAVLDRMGAETSALKVARAQCIEGVKRLLAIQLRGRARDQRIADVMVVAAERFSKPT